LALSDPYSEADNEEGSDPTGAEKPLGRRPAASGQRRLKILIDAYNRDLEHGTGISTYSRELARALRHLGHETHWLFARHTPKKADRLTDEVTFFDNTLPMSRLGKVNQQLRRMRQALMNSKIKAHVIHEAGTVIRDPDRPYEPNAFNASDLYERAHMRHSMRGSFTRLELKEKVDVFHLTAPIPVSLKEKGVQTVVTIHDLIPIRLPYTTLDNKREIIGRLRKSVEQASLVITVSEASKADIVNILHVDPDKVAVTYQTTDLKPFRPSERNALPRVLSRYGLEHRRFALFVSAIEPKKNLRRLIEAFLEVDTPMPLVIAGKKAWMWEREIGNIEATFGPRALRRLRFLGYVPRADLRYLYSGAAFLAFPSLYEGFGLPPLEAMQFGCPVLTSNVSSLPEICGEAALYVDPFDRDDIREKLERLVNEPELRKWLSEAGKTQAENYSFDRYVTRLGEAYDKLQR
jgi:glycosyltransferase involved in cell wall biosynthesis